MVLNFVYCFDENFNLQALTSINSLLDKLSVKANIYIIHKNIKTFELKINQIRKHQNLESVFLYQFDSHKIKLPPLKSHVSEATYYRLFLSQYLPRDIEYLIYIDADIICINDPTPQLIDLFSKIDNEGTVIAAKAEATRDGNKSLFERLNLINSEYFNAGVIVINYLIWLEKAVELDLLKILENRFHTIFDYDQEVLNIYFDGSFTKLDNTLNFQAIGGQDNELFNYIEKNVYFLHYLGKGKPWSVDNYNSSTSKFYQREFKNLGYGKPHIIFPKKLPIIKKFLIIIFKFEFLKFENPFKFIKYSFLAFFSKKFKSY